jgi:DNA-directed RNA polymerase subunit RPC12/RpoP
MEFICPHCDKTLHIEEKYLGKRGRCNHCGGRIALLGTPQGGRPMRATTVEDEGAASPEEAAPATPAQKAYLGDLGMTESQANRMTRSHAETEISHRRVERMAHEPPTQDQLDYLQRLGLPPKRLKAVMTKNEASRLIEEMLPPPTENQIAYLERLGANKAQILGLKSRAEASALIESFLRGGGGKG